ncbi:MAG: single-stranded-DNA-specific exonuclease RecJ [bacterium]|nr:single-stranded-DNA-specific exonuclease RecJ [bacterium]
MQELINTIKMGLTDFPLTDEILAILVKRGHDTPQKIKRFLKPKISDLTNPFTINDMQKAVKRIKHAIKNNEKILIYGDKDVDGQTSISLLKNFLEDLGVVADHYMPVGEGYGVHKLILAKLLEDEITLVITVDCGITAVDEINYLGENGIDIILTDHHEPLSILPEAYAIVNPKLSGGVLKSLAGVGVVFYLCWALLMSFAEYAERMESLDFAEILKADYAISNFFKKYLTFAALGTISDIMPLLEDNRFLVRYGLHNVLNSKIVTMDAWLKKLKCEPAKLNATFVSWNLTPVINSAGRMERPDLGVNFLCSKDSESGMKILKEIQTLNNTRRKIQKRDVKTVETMIGNKSENIIFVADRSINKNVTGIVANNIMKKYGKPTFVVAKGEAESSGSARAPKGYDMVSWFELSSSLLERFGGHKLAGGFTIKNENIEGFRDQLFKIAENKTIKIVDKVEIDLELDARKLTTHFLKEIFMLEPFGQANSIPKLLIKNCEFVELNYLGADKKHLKGKIKVGDGLVELIGWSMASEVEKIRAMIHTDIIASVDKNYFNGQVIIRLSLIECL